MPGLDAAAAAGRHVAQAGVRLCRRGCDGSRPRPLWEGPEFPGMPRAKRAAALPPRGFDIGGGESELLLYQIYEEGANFDSRLALNGKLGFY